MKYHSHAFEVDGTLVRFLLGDMSAMSEAYVNLICHNFPPTGNHLREVHLSDADAYRLGSIHIWTMGLENLEIARIIAARPSRTFGFMGHSGDTLRAVKFLGERFGPVIARNKTRLDNSPKKIRLLAELSRVSDPDEGLNEPLDFYYEWGARALDATEVFGLAFQQWTIRGQPGRREVRSRWSKSEASMKSLSHPFGDDKPEKSVRRRILKFGKRQTWGSQSTSQLFLSFFSVEDIVAALDVVDLAPYEPIFNYAFLWRTCQHFWENGHSLKIDPRITYAMLSAD